MPYERTKTGLIYATLERIGDHWLARPVGIDGPAFTAPLAGWAWARLEEAVGRCAPHDDETIEALSQGA
jgi:hypothetical protein